MNVSDVTKPKLPSTAVMFNQDGKCLFLIPEKPDWIVVSPGLAQVVRLCDGTRSMGDIRLLLSRLPGCEEAFKELSYIVENGFFDELKPRERKASKIGQLHLNMTPKCNLKCVYCYAEERDNTMQDRLTFQEYCSLVDEVHELFPECVMTFTGGEPLLNKDTIRVAEYCHELGMSTFILTNGTLVNESNAARVADAFDKIQISVDGPDRESHERQRGPGSYEPTMRAIDLLTKAGRTPSIATVLTQWNKSLVLPMVEKFPDILKFQPLYEVGRARDNEGIGLSGAEYYEAVHDERISKFDENNSMLQNLRNSGCTRCALGAGELSIAPNGDVFPCHMLHVPAMAAGNIRRQSLGEIYTHSEVLEKIRSYSVNTREECSECPIRMLCCGGCWARSYFATGDLNTPDPFCEYQMATFINGMFHTGLPQNTEEA